MSKVFRFEPKISHCLIKPPGSYPSSPNGTHRSPVRALVRSLGVGCANSHHHESWIRFCPGKRPLFCIKEAINHDRVAFSCVSPARPCRFAIDNVRSAVYGQTLGIMKDNFAAIRNFLWIDSTMSLAQRCAVPSCIRV